HQPSFLSSIVHASSRPRRRQMGTGGIVLASVGTSQHQWEVDSYETETPRDALSLLVLWQRPVEGATAHCRTGRHLHLQRVYCSVQCYFSRGGASQTRRQDRSVVPPRHVLVATPPAWPPPPRHGAAVR